MISPNSFIKNFREAIPHTEEQLTMVFSRGYCWHFAHMLKATFNRGDVVWCCPYGHCGWRDDNGIVYDIYGVVKPDRYMYAIPEEFLGVTLLDFKHTGDSPLWEGASVDEIIEVVMNFEQIIGVKGKESKISEVRECLKERK